MKAPSVRFRDGADTLRHRARGPVIALTLAKHAPVFALLLLPPAIWATLEGSYMIAVQLVWPSLLALAASAYHWKTPLPRDLRGIEAMTTLGLVFLLGALSAVPAFVALGMPALDAFFEAMSGLTTTGLTVATGPDDWPFAGHFLRGWLQWVGGLVMATAVLALVLPAGMPTRRLGQAGIDQGDRIASTRQKARQLLGVYVGVTLVFIALTLTAIPDWREALVLVLSGISTGGFAPRSDSLASYTTYGQGVVMLTCVAGAFSLLTYGLILRGRFAEAWGLGSLRRVLVAVATLLALFTLFWLLAGPFQDRAFYSAFLDLVSGLTTAGYSTGAMPLGGPFLILFLLAMIMGADAGSTGGGLKLARISLMLRGFRHAMRRPSLPENAVAPLRMDGEKVDSGLIIGVLALICIYLSALLVLWAHFALHGLPLAESLFESASALSTVGLSTGLVGADLPPDLKLSLTFAMWLGRLEFIAVLVLLLPRTWIRRK